MLHCSVSKIYIETNISLKLLLSGFSTTLSVTVRLNCFYRISRWFITGFASVKQRTSALYQNCLPYKNELKCTLQSNVEINFTISPTICKIIDII